ncbi:beta-glucosidase family protein [Dyella mobilis]|uniref:Glycoside hydrolase family 3 C-terminal domain-containing protein n=1 Tax=Dyella mobilis TaxID=1849582 RepID=A0ABS2KGN0_9GAMM|nr:glycoside hydrolase family 3 C-terminal domain-containing protein [Dyella mobilis]MBM7130323.1 glycoside hydrolase family 3 C-terminal domain-containing protein [Dyella mobilis]GLQ96949.1 glycosyl hydrolase [Dyella mobilis]
MSIKDLPFRGAPVRAMGLTMLALACSASAFAQQSATSTSTADKRADQLLKRMSLDDMHRLVQTYNTMVPQQPPGGIGTAGYVPAMPKLGIPALQENDASIGVHNYPTDVRKDGQPNHVRGEQGNATPLPSTLGIAATWNPQLAYDGGRMIGGEAHAQGINMLLAGGINLTREPRDGRTFEYLGEDPLLAARMDSAEIRGIQSQHVMSTIKHYAVNDQETNRLTVSSKIGERAMRESDLLAFELAIEEGHPASVMCGYNKVNGVWDCSNKHLLDDILKGDWKFPGWVMTDWGADHGVMDAMAGTDQVSGIDLGTGFSLGMTSSSFGQPLLQALKDGSIPRSRLDDMVHRILRSMYAVGVFEHPPVIKPLDAQADALVSQHAAEQGIVLLKNEQAQLPLQAGIKSVAIIGGHADAGVLSGGGSAEVWPIGGPAIPAVKGPDWQWKVYDPSSPMKALQKLLPNAKIVYDDGTDPSRAAALAKSSDVAIVFATQWTCEGVDQPNLALPDKQDALIDTVAAANPHSVVVLENGGPVTMPWLSRVSAVVESWYPGARGGEAIANVLTGKIDPSGRLPVTFPKDEQQLPRPTITQAQEVDYDIEGAAVGYKWFDEKKLEPLFPFGFGLSYSKFGYSDLHVSSEGDQVTVSFKVTNLGKRAGMDTPQVYVGMPADSGEAPHRLAGFDKVSLQPGQSQTVTLKVDPRLLAIFDVQGHQWQVAAGSYPIQVGHSSRDFELNGEAKVAAAHIAP